MSIATHSTVTVVRRPSLQAKSAALRARGAIAIDLLAARARLGPLAPPGALGLLPPRLRRLLPEHLLFARCDFPSALSCNRPPAPQLKTGAGRITDRAPSRSSSHDL